MLQYSYSYLSASPTVAASPYVSAIYPMYLHPIDICAEKLSRQSIPTYSNAPTNPRFPFFFTKLLLSCPLQIYLPGLGVVRVVQCEARTALHVKH